MPLSYSIYTGDGTTTVFSVPFPFLKKEHVYASVNGYARAFEWIGDTAVKLFPAPIQGAQIILHRKTPVTKNTTTFADGAGFRASDLNTNNKQLLYAIQELDEGLNSGGDSPIVVPNPDPDPTEYTPRKLLVIGGVRSISVYWGNQSGFDTEVWYSPTASFAGATKAATTASNSHTITGLESTTQYWVWIRTAGATELIGPESAWTLGLELPDFPEIKDVVSELIPLLERKIGSLEDMVNDLININIGLDFEKLAQFSGIDIHKLLEMLNIDVPTLKDGVDDIQKSIDDIRKNLIPIEVDLAGAIATLQRNINNVLAHANEMANETAQAVIDALIRLEKVGDMFKDAGFYVDPTTGRIHLWAVDQLRTDTGVRLSNAEIRLDAAESKILQKVGYAEVDERIAQMAFGNVGELLLSGVNARINEVLILLDGINASLALKATAIEVDELGGRIGDAEILISGLDAAIALKASNIEMDQLSTKLSAAELKIDALNGRISQEITQISQAGTDIEGLLADNLIDAILNGEDIRNTANIQLAHARNELRAYVEEGLRAEAMARTQLIALVEQNYAAFVEEKRTRADKDEAYAHAISELTAKTEDNSARIHIEATTRTTQDNALARQIELLDVSVGDRVNAAIVADRKVYVTELEALARDLTALATQIESFDGAIESKAGIEQLNQAISTLESSMASMRTLLVAEIEDVENKIASKAGIDQLNQAYTTLEEAMASMETLLSAQISDMQSEITGKAGIEQISAVYASLTESLAKAQQTIASEIKSLTDEIETKAGITQLQQAVSTLEGSIASTENAIVAEMTGELNTKAGIQELYQTVADLEKALSTVSETVVSEVISTRDEIASRAGIDQLRHTETTLDRAIALTKDVIYAELATLDEKIASKAGIVELQKTVAGLEEATAEVQRILVAELNGLEDIVGAKAGISDLSNAVTNLEGAITTLRTTLTSEFDDKLGGLDETLKGVIRSTDEARADATKAETATVYEAVSAAATPLAEGTIESVLDGEERARLQAQQFSAIRQELKTNIEAGLLSEASKRETLEAKLEDASAKLEEVRLATVKADGTVQALWTLKVDASGRVAGIGLVADQNTSEFSILAEKFLIYHADTAGKGVQAFTIADGQMVFNGDIFAKTLDNQGLTSGGKIVGDKLMATSQIVLNNGGKLLIGQGGSVQIGDNIYMDETRAVFLGDSFQMLSEVDGETVAPFRKVGDKIYLNNVIIEDGSVTSPKIPQKAVNEVFFSEQQTDVRITPTVTHTIVENTGINLTEVADGESVDVILDVSWSTINSTASYAINSYLVITDTSTEATILSKHIPLLATTTTYSTPYAYRFKTTLTKGIYKSSFRVIGSILDGGGTLTEDQKYVITGATLLTHVIKR